ncbi:Creatinase/aminopeptidase [Lindgomyces ingoldianus]|uniref:Creatinase/aminopeptidase n=1 Tax=Lindgomyces ingoldianus TaxID=673940 RepID=A0ACB6QRV7_9PLEO|nr:Creatinase/aminopeptidase [Lindgomyces ingoldianus]KAF2469759.1 Creatinase/aminopeptidase [Lindgomyces ingoldianus]
MEQIDAGNLAARLRWEQQDYSLHVEAASRLEKYPAKQHARRVVEKLGVPDGLVYLPGEPQRNNEDSDMPRRFRQKRYFYYLSGCNEPDCHLTYDIQNDTLSLFVPRINPKRVIWNGRGSTPAEAMDKYDIDQVFYIDELHDFIVDWRTYYRGSLYILHPSQNPLKPGSKDVDSGELQPAMNLARVIKDEHEIRMIKKANDISSRAHREVLANITKFKNEAQVEGLFLDVCISERAREQAYAPIVASGPNAGTLHYDDNNEDFDDRQLMCLDAGCEWELYASDITRSFPLSGQWPSKEAKDIYSLVQKIQDTCIQKLAPGVRYLDVHIMAHQIAIEGLLALGILHNGTSEEIYKAGTSRAFFPHGLGHHVGLEVHDPGQGDLMSMTRGNPKYEKAPSIFPANFHLPVYDSQTCRSPADPQSGYLEEGMVVTVEPGIYFSTYALNMFYLPNPIHSKYINTEAVARYIAVGGVRIEDDILITSKGYENLTTAPKAEAMLEIIRSGNAQWPFISGSTDLGPVVDSRIEKKPAEEEERPLLRAPGIKKGAAESILKPLRRAQTLPLQSASNHRSTNFEPFKGPPLFPKFKRATTLDVNASHSRNQLSVSTESQEPKPRNPFCGDDTSSLTHAYLDFIQDRPRWHRTLVSIPSSPTEVKPVCKKCTILAQTVDRLRLNLMKSEQELPKLGVKPAAARKAPEMSEWPRIERAVPMSPTRAEEKCIESNEVKRAFERLPEKPEPYRQSMPNLPQPHDGTAPRSATQLVRPMSIIPSTKSYRSCRLSNDVPLPSTKARRSATFDGDLHTARYPSQNVSSANIYDLNVQTRRKLPVPNDTPCLSRATMLQQRLSDHLPASPPDLPAREVPVAQPLLPDPCSRLRKPVHNFKVSNIPSPNIANGGVEHHPDVVPHTAAVKNHRTLPCPFCSRPCSSDDVCRKCPQGITEARKQRWLQPFDTQTPASLESRATPPVRISQASANPTQQNDALDRNLRKAMDMLWDIKQQLQRSDLGTERVWGDEGAEGRREWSERVVGDVGRAFVEQPFPRRN